MFKTTQQKINKLKQKIAGLEERIKIRKEFCSDLQAYMSDKVKLAELKECLRQLEIQLIEKQQNKHKSV